MTILDGFLLLGAMTLMLWSIRWHGRQLTELEVGVAQLHHALEGMQEEIKLLKLCIDVMEASLKPHTAPLPSNYLELHPVFNERKQ